MTIDPASPEFLNLSPREQACIYYFDIGWNEDALAEEFGITGDTLDRWLDSEPKPLPTMQPRRVRKKPRKFTAPPAISLNEIAALYVGEGLTLHQIAPRVGRSASWVRDRLIEAGVQLRSKGAWSASNSTKREAA